MTIGPIVTCGGSYMTPAGPRHDLAGCHFSEIIADKLGTTVIALGNGGCSNFSIALQVEAALKIAKPRPSMILMGNNPYDRIEIPLKQEIPHPGISDMLYHISDFITYHRTENPKFISTSLQDFFDEKHLAHWHKEMPDTDKFVQPVNIYFELLYNHNLKRKLDELICYYYYHQLHISKIPYFICHESLMDIAVICPWISNKLGSNKPYYLAEEFLKIIEDDKGWKGSSPFHTSKKCQEKLANLILERYEKNPNMWR